MRTPADTYADPHGYTGWLESGIGLDARATRSIPTLPPAPSPPGIPRRCTPSTPPLSLLFLFLFASFSLLSAGYPSTTWPTCSFAHSRERDDTVETGFRPAEDSGRKYSAQQKIF